MTSKKSTKKTKDKNADNEKENKDLEPIYISRRSKGRRMGDEDSGGSTWLISFTDVMALMLTFFVLLFSMSNPKIEDWEKFTDTVQKNFNRFYGHIADRGPEDSVNIEKINFSQALNLNYLRALIQNLQNEEPSLQSAKLINNGNQLIISLPQSLLFNVGEVSVKSEANQSLFTLAGTLGRIKNRVEVVGHTDPQPTSGEEFKSNWELSLARAANVAAVLENVGYERPIIIRGQASGRYYDLSKDIPQNERLDLSRRVDIVVMEDDGKRMKLFDMDLKF